MSIPPSDTPVGSFEVQCRVGQFVMDSDDPDRAPDLAALGGRVTIEPDLNRPIRVNDSTGTRVVGVDPLEFTIDAATGQLVHPDGDPGVELIDPTDEHLDPQGWTYTARVQPAKGRSWTVTFGAPADGSVVDLGSIASVAPSPGITANYVQQTVEARDQAESFAVRAEAAADEAEGYAPTFAWDGTSLVIDGETGPDLKGEKGDGSSWADLTGKPTTYPPDTHTHEITDVDGLQAALPRTTTWQVLGTVPGLTAGECLFRWANGQPQLSLKSVEWLAGAAIPWTAMPAGSRIDFNARSSAILSGASSLATQRGIVAYYAGTNFIYMGPEASPMPMSGMITWTV